MGFSTTDWVALVILGVSALVGTFAKRLVRIIGLAVMPFALTGLVLSLSHHASVPVQGPVTNNAPGINTNNTNDQSGGTNVLNIIGPQRLLFDATIGDQLASKLYQSGNLLRFWLLDLEPIGILRTNMPNI